MIYAEVEIEWKGERAARNMLSAVLDGIEHGAHFLAGKIRDNIDIPSPPASAPGEYPHADTFELHDRVRVEVDRRRKTCHVTSEAEHSAVVEESRPFLRRTYLENKSALRRAVLAKSKQSYGHFRIVG